VTILGPSYPSWGCLRGSSSPTAFQLKANRKWGPVPIDWHDPLAWSISAGKEDFLQRIQPEVHASKVGVEESDIKEWISMPLRVPNLTVIELMSEMSWNQGRSKRSFLWKELERNVDRKVGSKDVARLKWEKLLWASRNKSYTRYTQAVRFNREEYVKGLRQYGLVNIGESFIKKTFD
jgi:hypothetical protein